MSSRRPRLTAASYLQVDGDMGPIEHGGSFARKIDADSVDLVRVQPVLAYCGEGALADSGGPLWVSEAAMDRDDAVKATKSRDWAAYLDSFGRDVPAVPCFRCCPVEVLASWAPALLENGGYGWDPSTVPDIGTMRALRLRYFDGRSITSDITESYREWRRYLKTGSTY